MTGDSSRWMKVAVLSLVVAGAGCRFGPSRPCSTNADCGGVDVCDVELGACVVTEADPDAGSVCEPACAAHEECALKSCRARFSAVVMSAPANGTMVKPAAQVAVSASLTLVSGRTAQLPDALILQISDPSGAVTEQQLTRAGDVFTSSWTAGTAVGDYQLSARYADANLTSAPVTVTVDVTAPTFTLSLSPPVVRAATDAGTSYVDPELPDGGSYRRDEELVVVLSSNDSDVDPASATISAAFAGGLAKTFDVTASVGCGGNYCGTARVNLWEVPMNAARGAVTLTATATDRAGNEGSAQQVAEVTRWKWVNTSSAGNAIVGSPALDRLGNLYFAYSTGSSGWVRSLDPDGRLRWSRTGGGPVVVSPAAGLADGGEIVVLGEQSGGNSTLVALDVRDGGVVSNCGAYAGTIRGSVAMTTTLISGEPRETAFAHVSGNGGRLVALRVGAGAGDDCIVVTGVGAMPTDATSIVTRGNVVHFGDSLGQVAGHQFNNGLWSQLPNWPSQVGLFTRALAFVGTDVVGGGGGPSEGGMFSISPAGGPPAWELRTTAPAWSPAIADGGMAFVGIDGPALLTGQLYGDAGTTYATQDVVRSTPVIGEGGWLYLPSVDGTLSVRRLATPGVTEWTVSGLGQLDQPANLDCARDNAGQARPGRPGTLYAVASSGEVYAIIVDSRGLDATAPWPKYQHDAQNSGNPLRPVAACP